jgi:hypothetical protein
VLATGDRHDDTCTSDSMLAHNCAPHILHTVPILPMCCTAAGLVSETLSTGMGYTRVGVEPAATFTRFNSPLLSDKLDGTYTYLHIIYT